MKNNNDYSFDECLQDGLYINLADSAAYKLIYNAGMKLPTFITFGLFDTYINADSNEAIEEHLTSLLTDAFLEIKDSDNAKLHINTVINDKKIDFDAQLQISNEHGKVILLSLPNEVN
tara:strand:+ start:36 stop:389 length:354 start_codon:yes stop_codon:yes gene_type:complete